MLRSSYEEQTALGNQFAGGGGRQGEGTAGAGGHNGLHSCTQLWAWGRGSELNYRQSPSPLQMQTLNSSFESTEKKKK